MLSEARRYAAAAKKERADRYSANVPVIREIHESGAPSRLADDEFAGSRIGQSAAKARIAERASASMNAVVAR